MKFSWLITAIIIFQSCASTIVWHSPEQRPNLNWNQETTKKSITFRRFSKMSSNIYWSPDKFLFDDGGPYEEEKIRNALESSQLFSKIEVQNSPKKFIDKTDEAKISEYFEDNAYNKSTDMQLNIYTMGQAGHAYIILPYMVWFVAHVGTVGLVPFWIPGADHYYGDFRSSNGKILYKFEKKCSASVWFWSPLIFVNGWAQPKKSNTEIFNDCIFSLIEDAHKAGVL